MSEEKEEVSGSHKSWIFTINNYTLADQHVVTSWSGDATRLVATLEVGDEKGTPHIQGAVTWTGSKRFAFLKKLHPRASWRIQKAEHAASLYCLKADSTVLVNVDNRKQGERKDIQNVYKAIEAGESIQTWMRREYPPERLIKLWRTAKMELAPDRPIGQIEVIWRWGPTGSGKTRWCYENYPTLYRVCDPELKWWDAYDGQETVLIDDYRMANTRQAWLDFLKLTDIYPFNVQVKGGWAKAQYKRIIFTSPDKPEDALKPNGEDLNQALRRIVTVTEVALGNTN